MKTLLSRRALLRRTGAAALFTLPFVNSLEAFAQGAPKKGDKKKTRHNDVLIPMVRMIFLYLLTSIYLL